MNRIILVLAIMLMVFNGASACLNTYQYKIFPVGTYKDQVVCIDVQIKRSEQSTVDKHFKMGRGRAAETAELWTLKTYISVYDHKQKLISNQVQEIKQVKGKSYVQLLQKMYKRSLKKVQEQYAKINLLKARTIHFCNFKKHCDQVKLIHKAESNKDYLQYQNKSYPLSILKDKSYIGFNNSMYYADNSKSFYLSSTRVYSNSEYQIVFAHLETGTNLAFYDDKTTCTIPDISWGHIENSVYQEPVLHHAYGYDVFVVKKK